MINLTDQEIGNKKVFSDKNAVEQYSHFYLFPVEERIFDAHFAEPGTILDIGCGCGRTSLFLKQRGHTVTGIDIVPEMIEAARKLVEGVEFKIMDACELTFADESFDYVLFSFNGIDCIYPEEKRDRCLREICRVLKPGHFFVFSTHNALSLKSFFPSNRFRLANWLLNVKRRRFFSRYRLEKHPTGILENYFTSPFRQKRKLKKMCFREVNVYGQSSDHPIFTHFIDGWPYYVCRKDRC